MKKIVPWILVVAVAFLCGCRHLNGSLANEDKKAKQLLQGIWIDENTNMPFIRVMGDSLYFADADNMAATFYVVGDTLYIQGKNTVSYKIDRQTPYEFYMRSLSGEQLKLYKSETTDDEYSFTRQETEPLAIVQEDIKRDSVITYAGEHYHGYAIITPSKMKVIKSSVDESGIEVNNEYYDNVVNISVYKGDRKLYSQEIVKQMFAEVLAEDVLSELVLADTEFVGVDASGYHFKAILAVPDSSLSYITNLDITPDGRLHISKSSGN